MQILIRPLAALLAFMVLGLTAPAMAQGTLTTADPQVCCSGKDAAGRMFFFLTPKSQCPRRQVVAMERCKKREVCCRTPRNNRVFETDSVSCKRAGGTVVPASYCRRKICCRTHNGYYETTANRCKQARGKQVKPAYCRNQTTEKICCKFIGANGNIVHGFLSPKVCKGYKGTKVANHYCATRDRNLRLR